jgi:hypothetical protein
MFSLSSISHPISKYWTKSRFNCSYLLMALADRLKDFLPVWQSRSKTDVEWHRSPWDWDQLNSRHTSNVDPWSHSVQKTTACNGSRGRETYRAGELHAPICALQPCFTILAVYRSNDRSHTTSPQRLIAFLSILEKDNLSINHALLKNAVLRGAVKSVKKPAKREILRANTN